MINENDSILVFEYFTASGEKEQNIISEAEELIFALLDDLSDFNVDLVINKSYEDIVKDFSNVNPILIDENIVDWLEGNAADFKNAIFIAAETGNALYDITRILEENDVKTYTSRLKLIRIKILYFSKPLSERNELTFWAMSIMCIIFWTFLRTLRSLAYSISFATSFFSSMM